MLLLVQALLAVLLLHLVLLLLLHPYVLLPLVCHPVGVPLVPQLVTLVT
jgi:hypothetical protein